MTTLKEIIDARTSLNTQNLLRQKEYGDWCEEYKTRLRALNQAEALLASGVDLDRLRRGEAILSIQGDYRCVGGESSDCIASAKADLAAGAPRLMREYFGAKNYDRWSGQRSDHTYGFGPKHGHIAFAIGLKSEARNSALTEQQIEDALYLLANIDRVLDARKVAA